MTPATPTELQRLIAAAFDAQGWEYDLSIGPKMVQWMRIRGTVDADQLVRLLPDAFFQHNRVDRASVSKAIERAIGDRSLKEESAVAATIVIADKNYHLNVGAGASIVNSSINLGEGTQITVGSGASREAMLLAVEALVRAGLAGDWSDDAGRDLAEVVNAHPDLAYEDVQRVVVDVVEAEQPTRERVKDFLARIAASGLGGALGTGITAGLGEAISQLPI